MNGIMYKKPYMCKMMLNTLHLTTIKLRTTIHNSKGHSEVSYNIPQFSEADSFIISSII